MTRPLVSVIIPTYNSAHFAVAAVQSVAAQTYPEVEIVVADDGSKDDTRERVERLDPRVRYTYQPNGGVSKARNLGLSVAKGELIAFLDADDRWLPTKLEKQIDCLDATPDVDMVHTDVRYWHENTGQESYERLPRERFQGECYREFFWFNQVITSTVLVRRTCIDRIGIFDEAVRGPSAEDMDLWIRIARHHRLAYVDEPLALYRIHSGNGSANQKRMTEDEFYVFDKALREDPALRAALGSSNVRAKMSDLAFHSGLANLEARAFERARGYFRRGTSYAPGDLRLWMFWASTALPPDMWNALRQIKRRLAATPDRPAA